MRKKKPKKKGGFVDALVRSYRSLKAEVGADAARPILVASCSMRFGPMGAAVMEHIARTVDAMEAGHLS